MKNAWFSIEIKPEIARRMTRAEYYQVRSWLRFIRWKMMKTMVQP